MVQPGELDPNNIHIPGCYVQRIIHGRNYSKKIERITTRQEGGKVEVPNATPAQEMRERIVRRAAKELKDGMYVNLGIGMPTLAPNFLDEGVRGEEEEAEAEAEAEEGTDSPSC